MKKIMAGLAAAVAFLTVGFVGIASASPTPPDVGDTAGPVLSSGFTAVLSAFTDLAPWLIPVGLAVLVVRKGISAMSKGRAPRF